MVDESPGHDAVSTAFLLVEVTRRGEPVWAAKWRGADGARTKRRLGARAWLERDGTRGWRPRVGRPRPGYLTERQARRLIANVVRAAEQRAAEERRSAARARAQAERASAPTFRQ